jgi:hypothetical protein
VAGMRGDFLFRRVQGRDLHNLRDVFIHIFLKPTLFVCPLSFSKWSTNLTSR